MVKGLSGVVETLIVLLSALIGIMAALWLGPGAGRLTNNLSVAIGLIFLIACVLAWLMSWLIGKKTTRFKRSLSTIGLTAVIMSALTIWIVTPPQRKHPPSSVPSDVTFWSLSTGSKLAYHHTAAQLGHRAAPIFLLHGGPGLPALPMFNSLSPFDSLALLGYDVYYYDQFGAGYSNRADLAVEPVYTVNRHVEDLEAIRKTVGVEKMILIGSSWGATLAANYLLRYPDRVERVVFESPAPLWYPEHPDFPMPQAFRSLTKEEAATLSSAQTPTPRIAAGRVFAQVNPQLATALITDWEVDEWWGEIMRLNFKLGQPKWTCRADVKVPDGYFSTIGFFVYTNTEWDATQLPDPRPALRKLTLPVLVLRGECDWIKPEVASEYRDIFPSARLVSVSNAGHATWFENPSRVRQIVAAFLLDEKLPE